MFLGNFDDSMRPAIFSYPIGHWSIKYLLKDWIWNFHIQKGKLSVCDSSIGCDFSSSVSQKTIFFIDVYVQKKKISPQFS